MRIIKATEPITVDHPVFLIFGQPGIGKSSLGYSADEPLLLDADQGAHRAVNRRDTLAVSTWADILELVQGDNAADALAPYKTIVLDTVGRVLDHLTVFLVNENPKYDRGGGDLSLQGFGALKARFKTWLNRVQALGKDVVMIAHHKEEKDGDAMIVRPDVVGGSYAEIMKLADFVGYLHMRGRDRVLDFNPTDRWVGKNPGQWPAFKVPAANKSTTFLAERVVEGRAVLGRISESSAKIAQLVDGWRGRIGALATAADCNKALPEINALQPAMVVAQVKQLLRDRIKAIGVTFDAQSRAFVGGPVPAPAPAQQPEPAAATAEPARAEDPRQPALADVGF